MLNILDKNAHISIWATCVKWLNKVVCAAAHIIFLIKRLLLKKIRSLSAKCSWHDAHLFPVVIMTAAVTTGPWQQERWKENLHIYTETNVSSERSGVLMAAIVMH